jgi:predicted XRE-type DNA-binding protein
MRKKIDRTKLLTQSEYARMLGISRARVNQLVKSKSIKVVEIRGATLVYLE